MIRDHMLLFGHSHANCVAAALQSPETYSAPDVTFEMVTHGSTGLPGALVLEDANQRDVINPILLKAIDSRAARGPGERIWLVSMVAGNYAAELSMFKFSHSWDTLLPGEDIESFPAGAKFIHCDAIMMTLERKLGHFKRFLAAIPLSKLAGFIHIEAPPPVRDPAFIIAKMPEKSRLLAREAGIDELNANHISAASYRSRVWKCQHEVIRRAVEGDNRFHLSPPLAAMDGEGFLLEKLRKDPSHANHAYGRMVLEEVANFARSKRRQEAIGEAPTSELLK